MLLPRPSRPLLSLVLLLTLPTGAQEPSPSTSPASSPPSSSPAPSTASASDAGTTVTASPPPPTPDAQKPAGAELDEISVTATRVQRKTQEVPAAITVIDQQTIKSTKNFSLKDAIQGTPGVLVENAYNGYSSRLIVRGAGAKAAYGVREIMVLMDGVPVTDPDSFTRLDFVDMELIEKIEVVRGPSSTLWGANAAGGVINFITKNPLALSGGTAKLGFGDLDTQSVHLGYAVPMGEHLNTALGYSYRHSGNTWSRWNDFSTHQVSVRPTILLSNGILISNNVNYTKADTQLPGSLSEEQFSRFKLTGRRDDTYGPFQFSGRYAESLYLSSKAKIPLKSFELNLLGYVNLWKHRHPITGRINLAQTGIGGIDLQANHRHRLGFFEGTATLGAMLRYDNQQTNYYEYAEVLTEPARDGQPSITRVLSDRLGTHQQRELRRTWLGGVYAQETARLWERLLLDVGLRFDSVAFDIASASTGAYDYSKNRYTTYAQPLNEKVAKQFNAFSPRVGLTYGVVSWLNLYATYGEGIQTPTESELSANPKLGLVRVKNLEGGLKARHRTFTVDAAFYYSPVENEVVRVYEGFQSTYQNAGRTTKLGAEVAASVEPVANVRVGGTYTFTNYRFEEFQEVVGFGASTRTEDRKGKSLPYVPAHYASLFASYRHPSGFKARITSNTWGDYWMDNANTQRYPGYRFITSAAIGYENRVVDLNLTVDNVFDQRYAVEAQKSTSGVVSYEPASPRMVMGTLTYKF